MPNIGTGTASEEVFSENNAARVPRMSNPFEPESRPNPTLSHLGGIAPLCELSSWRPLVWEYIGGDLNFSTAQIHIYIYTFTYTYTRIQYIYIIHLYTCICFYSRASGFLYMMADHDGRWPFPQRSSITVQHDMTGPTWHLLMGETIALRETLKMNKTFEAR